MSHESPQSSSVKLVTAAYLEQPFQTGQPVPKVAEPGGIEPFHSVAFRIMKVLPGVFLCVLLIGFLIAGMTVYAKEKDRRTCGFDWIMWAFGSDQTFESVVTKKLEEGRRDMERVTAESKLPVTQFDMRNLNLQPVQWNRK
jgi:hypothetical protein